MAPSFISLGMVVLDELRFPGGQIMHDIAGGSGAYSTLGARVVAGKKHSQDVGCVILTGHDFPSTIRAQFESWGLDLVIVEEPGRHSTRGLLTYEDEAFEQKTFKYTTKRLQPMPINLTTSLLGSAGFHFLASPALLQDQLQQLSELRKDADVQTSDLIVWEPLPGLCQRDMRDAHLAAAKLVHIFSPNHIEFLALFGESETQSQGEFLDRAVIESCADKCLDSGIGREGKGAVIVRAAGDGCLVSSKVIPGRHRWLPPFYRDWSSIIDATGAGNTFLGAFTFAMSGLPGEDIVEASVLASVATSFSLEQFGLPRLSYKDGEELWNGEAFKKRCIEYRKRLGPD